MKKTKRRSIIRNWLILIFGLTICFGCTRIRTDVAPLDDKLMTRFNPGIQLTTGDLDRPYKERGIIFVKGRHVNYGKIMEELQSKAKELGADAVIKIKFGNEHGYSRRLSCQGVAVIFE